MEPKRERCGLDRGGGVPGRHASAANRAARCYEPGARSGRSRLRLHPGHACRADAGADHQERGWVSSRTARPFRSPGVDRRRRARQRHAARARTAWACSGVRRDRAHGSALSPGCVVSGSQDRGWAVPGRADRRAAWRGCRPRPFWRLGRSDTSHRRGPGSRHRRLAQRRCPRPRIPLDPGRDHRMGESSFDRWARVLVDYSTEVTTGDQVAISGGVAAEPLLRAIFRAVLRNGGHPVLLPSFSEEQADFFHHASDEQLEYISPLERWVLEEAPVTIAVQASTNTRALSAIDPSRQSVWSRARTELRKMAFARAARGERRWSSTIFPTPAHAQDADMATDQVATFLEAACLLDRSDPIAAWRELSKRQARMIDWLQERREIHITAPGTDLRLSISGRAWVNSDGK